MKNASPYFSCRRLGRFSPQRRGDAAFSLLELSIVIFIISVLAAVAVPVFKRLTIDARTSAIENDLRVFSGAFQAYAQEHGDWPPGDTGPGEFPPAMATSLGRSNWTRVTPIGGRYTWAPNSVHQGERYHAAIVISAVEGQPVTAERRQLEAIDRAIDDGSLDTGNFRLGFRNFPVFVIEH